MPRQHPSCTWIDLTQQLRVVTGELQPALNAANAGKEPNGRETFAFVTIHA
jgi:hypothetical protein